MPTSVYQGTLCLLLLSCQQHNPHQKLGPPRPSPGVCYPQKKLEKHGGRELVSTRSAVCQVGMCSSFFEHVGVLRACAGACRVIDSCWLLWSSGYFLACVGAGGGGCGATSSSLARFWFGGHTETCKGACSNSQLLCLDACWSAVC